jgi:hypothetical protein
MRVSVIAIDRERMRDWERVAELARVRGDLKVDIYRPRWGLGRYSITGDGSDVAMDAVRVRAGISSLHLTIGIDGWEWKGCGQRRSGGGPQRWLGDVVIIAPLSSGQRKMKMPSPPPWQIEMVSWFGLPVGRLGGPDRWAAARWWFSLFFLFKILFYFLILMFWILIWILNLFC